jgi:AcrR family transcriptional regulator
MRYSKVQKSRTRQRIIENAMRLFAARGYTATSIDDIMRGCDLTRGGFYAHFSCKSELYRVAIGGTGQMHEPPLSRNGACGKDNRIDDVLGACLDRECHAFLAADVASDEPEVRTAYTDAFKNMSARIRGCTNAHSSCSEESVLSAAAMIIGTLAVARTTDDADLQRKLVASCRENARALLEPGDRHAPPVLFWAPGAD